MIATPIDAVARGVTLATKEQTARQRAVDDLVLSAETANAEFVADDSDENLEKVTKLRVRLERARVLLATAETNLSAATERQRLADVERLKVEVAEDKITLSRFDDSLSLLVAALVDLDKHADETLLQVARSVKAGQVQHDAATSRAQLIGARIETPRPTFADVKLSIARTLTRLRAEEGREDCSELFATVADDWRTESLGAADLAAHRARVAENERAALVTQGMQNAVNAINTPPSTASTEVTQ